jgi:FkbM family methyltransferase
VRSRSAKNDLQLKHACEGRRGGVKVGMTENALIYDVGAHKGEDTEFYLKKGFSVVAIEAVPQLCGELKQRFFDEVERGKLKILNLAVSRQTGTVNFYIDKKNSVWGTTKMDWVARNKPIGGGPIRKISVGSSSLSDMMKTHGVPRYCKIDIEGNDLDALKSLAAATTVPRFISLESEKINWMRLVEEFSILNDLGYRRFKIIDQSLVYLQNCPFPPLEGRYCNHAFGFGSSGLFGDELPGKWLDMFEALEVYKGIFRGYALNGDNGFFSRRADVFHLLGHIQAMIANLRGFGSYINPAHTLPPAGWYDTHAAL